MAAKDIPAVGEVYLGGNPHPLKVMKATWGHATTLDQSVASSIASTYRTLFNLPAGCLVPYVGIYVRTGFNTSQISVGDTDNTSGWFAATSDQIKTTGLFRLSFQTTEPVSAFKGGKYYAAAGHIRVKNTTKITTGKLEVYCFYTLAPNG